jgi:DNA-binding MarR family transcriptional regulator
MAKQFNELEITILSDLAHAGTDWKRPQELGGSTKSPHSRVLRKFADKGLVEKRRVGEDESRRSGYLYRITKEGQSALRQELERQGREIDLDLPGRHDEHYTVGDAA